MIFQSQKSHLNDFASGEFAINLIYEFLCITKGVDVNSTDKTEFTLTLSFFCDLIPSGSVTSKTTLCSQIESNV